MHRVFNAADQRFIHKYLYINIIQQRKNIKSKSMTAISFVIFVFFISEDQCYFDGSVYENGNKRVLLYTYIEPVCH